MIKQDRIELNDRFIKVFGMLEDRGVIVKNDRNGRGMGDFAEKILGNRQYGHIIRAFLNGKDKRVISYSQARTLCREYGVNENFMLDGIGTPFGMEVPTSTNDGSNIGNIMFTSTQAFAGATFAATASPSSASESNTFFSMPGLAGGGLVAFPINGNSMEPVIQNGDMVICRQIEDVNDIRDNEIYAVKSNGNVWIKYVQKIHHGNRVTHLKMISANHLEHDPFVEEVNVHTRLFKVVRRVMNL